MIKRINHLAIVVEDLDAALRFWRDALGLPLHRTEENHNEDVHIAFLPVGESEIELLQPMSEESGIGKYLVKKGQGIHHVCVEVDDIDATIERLKAQGVMMINDTPKVREEGTRYAFIHPKSASGALVELYELPKA
jgi:methylmalonyl-CoA/ethylmalonyl-CoA epimerase